MNKIMAVAIVVVLLLVGGAVLKVVMTAAGPSPAAEGGREQAHDPAGAPTDEFEEAGRIVDEREEGVEEARQRIRALTGGGGE